MSTQFLAAVERNEVAARMVARTHAIRARSAGGGSRAGGARFRHVWRAAPAGARRRRLSRCVRFARSAGETGQRSRGADELRRRAQAGHAVDRQRSRRDEFADSAVESRARLPYSRRDPPARSTIERFGIRVSREFAMRREPGFRRCRRSATQVACSRRCAPPMVALGLV